jgi:hypothetical protein
MTATTRHTVHRSFRLRAVGGYTAAAAITPYLVIKILWTCGLLLPRPGMAAMEWRAINAATAVLAAAGVAVALSLVRPWGERLPAWTVIFPGWVGTGLLVPVVLVMPILGPAAISRDHTAGGTQLWTVEQLLVVASFAGIGIGLPLAFAGYVRDRWPVVFSAPSHDDDPAGYRPLLRTLARLAGVAAVAVGCWRLLWALGITIGTDPALAANRDLWWRMLNLSSGLWLLAGAWGLYLMAVRGTGGWVATTLTWVSSGTAFAFGLPFLDLSAMNTPEYPLLHATLTQGGALIGLLMGLTGLLVLYGRSRRRVPTEPAP